MRQKTTLEQRRQHVAAWQSSGLSQAAYCRRHGIKLPTFHTWQGLYKEQESLPSSLVPVRIERSLPTLSSPVVLRDSRGYSLEIPATHSAQWVAELLRCLD